jgi:hypothetical protein
LDGGSEGKNVSPVDIRDDREDIEKKKKKLKAMGTKEENKWKKLKKMGKKEEKKWKGWQGKEIKGRCGS